MAVNATAGQAALVISAVLVVIALVRTIRGRDDAARGWLGGAFAAIAVALVVLATALLKCDFRLLYVVDNTSLDLPGTYRFAALWAGQEGTVLLWIAMLELAALSLLKRERNAPRGALGAFLVLVLGFHVLLFFRSPFVVGLGTPPADGHGLNPLLKNPWMVIHPPVLFVGYSLLFVPYALALAAVWRGQPDTWLRPARPYLVWGWVSLGAGMMLGGYWAYITLGWGGFWAWDPVENSSLIPWLFATALLHGVALQRDAGSYRKFNFVLALCSAATIIYGSYLTRSGVLGDFSVHSFQTLGQGYNAAWLTLLLVPIAAGIVAFRRGRPALVEVAVPRAYNWLSQAVWVVFAMAALVLLGTSMPLISKLFGDAKAVETSFYNRTQSILLVLSAVFLVLHLKPGRQVVALLTAAAVAGGWAVQAALKASAGAMPDKPAYDAVAQYGLLILGGGAGAMIVVGLDRSCRLAAQKRWGEVGYGLAHIGIAVLALGAMLSGPGEQWQQVVLELGQTQETLGVTVGFETHDTANETEHLLTLSLDEGGNKQTGLSKVYPTNNGEMRTPVLFHDVTGDWYLEPVQLLTGAQAAEHGGHSGMTGEPAVAGDVVTVAKGKTIEHDGLKLTFTGYAQSADHMSGDSFAVGADLEVDAGSGVQQVTPLFKLSDEGTESEPVTVGDWEIRFVKMNVDGGTADLALQRKGGAAAPPEAKPAEEKPTEQKPALDPITLVLRVTRKPWIGLVWLGTLLLVLGGALGLARQLNWRREAAPPPEQA